MQKVMSRIVVALGKPSRVRKRSNISSVILQIPTVPTSLSRHIVCQPTLKRQSQVYTINNIAHCLCTPTPAPGSSLLEESLLDSLVQQELQLRQRASGLSSGSADTPEDDAYKLGSISLTPGLSDPRLMGFGGADDASGGLPGAAKPHICYDFTKGLCNRGDKCKYSHDLATIVTYNSKEKVSQRGRAGKG